MEKIRLLFLITDLNKGGAERFLIDFCTELNKRDDLEYRIACLYDNNQYQTFTTNLPIVQLQYQTFSFRKKNECPAYQSLLKEFKPHIIHTHRFLAEFLSSYYLNPEIKYVCHGHDNMEQLIQPKCSIFFNKRLFINYLERKFLIRNKYNRVPTYFIANSKHTEAFYQSIFPKRNHHQVKLIPLGFNFERFYNPHNKVIQPSEKLKIINVGSFLEKKNQKFIVDIAIELKKRDLSFEINLLGDGIMRSKVEEKVVAQGLSDCIFFHGNVSNVEEHLRESHLYLHTAMYEPFGLVFLEAMASGLPIICLDGKGNRDIIESGRNGFLFDSEEPDRLAASIMNLVKEPQLYEDISNYCKTYAKQYDMKAIVTAFINFYRSIL